MAAYPSIGLNHSIQPLTRRIVDISDAGTIRTADLNQTPVYRISLDHPVIDNADRATLIAFYDANKNNMNTITLAGEVYETHFEGPYTVDNISSSWFNVSVNLVGVKQ